MKFSLAFLALASSAMLAAASSPSFKDMAQNPDQITFENVRDNLVDSLPKFDDDACPDMKVRCIKDGDITKVVGDVSRAGHA